MTTQNNLYRDSHTSVACSVCALLQYISTKANLVAYHSVMRYLDSSLDYSILSIPSTSLSLGEDTN